jgi:UDP-N-acetylglucosamine transferase subunit ALG13
MTTFVSIGNAHQSFRRLLNGVVETIDLLPRPVIIQCGRTPFHDTRCVYSPFFRLDQYNKFIQDAELLILHAGAGSVIKALRAGKLPIVVPRRKKYREHINDHQLDFAIALSKMDKIELVLETSDLKRAINNVLANNSSGKSVTRNNYATTVIKNTLSNFETIFIRKTNRKNNAFR